MKSSQLKKIIFIILAILTLFFILHNILVRAPGYLERMTARVAYPLLVVQKKIGDWGKSMAFARMRQHEYEQTVTALQQERDDIRSRLIAAEQQLAYVDETEELIAFKKRFYDVPAVLAHVLVKDISPHSSYVYVDAGERQGIKPDMVAVYKNCMVGRVHEVYPSYAKIMLITDQHCKIAATCVHTCASGIYEGTNGPLSRLNFVSHLQQVEEGDTVVSSGHGMVFPQGFALGVIKQVQPDGLYYQVTVEPLLDFAQLSYCYLLSRDTLA